MNSGRCEPAYLFADLYAANSGGDRQLSHADRIEAALNADYSFAAGRCWRGGVGPQIIYSAAACRQPAPHVRAVSPHYLLPLGYEQYNVRLLRLQRVVLTL